MNLKMVVVLVFISFLSFMIYGQSKFESDIIKTKDGDLKITFIDHASLMMEFKGKIIQIDPYSKNTDYTKFPKADLILITHDHGDHLDPKAIEAITKAGTKLVITEKCREKAPKGQVMKNGDVVTLFGIKIEATPAYNLVNMRKEGIPYHAKGDGNGYVLTISDKIIYIAGDTENTPEMKALKNIDIAFLPMNLPYTMTPEMVSDAVLSFKPRILYPYHFGETDTLKLVELLKNNKEIELRIRKMK